jgi:triosephosphate isomerase
MANVERKMIVAGNWKMNLSLAEAVNLASAIAQIPLEDGVEVTIFPTFICLVPVAEALNGASAKLGAQDAYIEDSGAFTGEVSPSALAEICQAVLVGHSERRHVFGETDELIGLKVDAILRAAMTAYLCVGETLTEREAGKAEAVVHTQLAAGLENVAVEQLGQLVVAYEPVWAIGTGVAASSDDAQEMCRSVRAWLGNRYGDPGRAVQVLYGGSVSPDNVDELFGCADIDGGLVGGASLSADSFEALIEAANRIAAV